MSISRPRPFCCLVLRLAQGQHFQASGKADALGSYVINHRPAAPVVTPPYAIAVVEL